MGREGMDSGTLYNALRRGTIKFFKKKVSTGFHVRCLTLSISSTISKKEAVARKSGCVTCTVSSPDNYGFVQEDISKQILFDL